MNTKPVHHLYPNSPSQLRSCVKVFCANILCYGLFLRECQKWKEKIQIANFKVLLSNNIFHTTLLSFFKNSNSHKISFFNARDLKLALCDMLFPLLAFFKVALYSNLQVVAVTFTQAHFCLCKYFSCNTWSNIYNQVSVDLIYLRMILSVP